MFVKCYDAAEPLDRYRGLALPARAIASHCNRCSDLQAPRLLTEFRCVCVPGCCVLFVRQMSAADYESAVLEMFGGLEDDERLGGSGLAAAFAAAFPDLPDAESIPSLTTSTGWARVAGLLGDESDSVIQRS